jgi:hypothetical protein
MIIKKRIYFEKLLLEMDFPVGVVSKQALYIGAKENEPDHPFNQALKRVGIDRKIALELVKESIPFIMKNNPPVEIGNKLSEKQDYLVIVDKYNITLALKFEKRIPDKDVPMILRDEAKKYPNKDIKEIEKEVGDFNKCNRKIIWTTTMKTPIVTNYIDPKTGKTHSPVKLSKEEPYLSFYKAHRSPERIREKIVFIGE